MDSMCVCLVDDGVFFCDSWSQRGGGQWPWDRLEIRIGSIEVMGAMR